MGATRATDTLWMLGQNFICGRRLAVKWVTPPHWVALPRSNTLDVALLQVDKHPTTGRTNAAQTGYDLLFGLLGA